jgi:hypothetical protein
MRACSVIRNIIYEVSQLVKTLQALRRNVHFFVKMADKNEIIFENWAIKNDFWVSNES